MMSAGALDEGVFGEGAFGEGCGPVEAGWSWNHNHQLHQTCLYALYEDDFDLDFDLDFDFHLVSGLSG